MKSKRTIAFLVFACLLAFAFSISLTLVAGGKGEIAPFAPSVWDMSGGGSTIISTTTPTNNNRSWILTIDFIKYDHTLGGFFPNAAPEQGLAYGDGWMTEPGMFENRWVAYRKNIDGSLAYVLICRGKGKFPDDHSIIMKSSIYVFLPGFTDADGNGFPDNDTEAIYLGDSPSTGRIISTSIPPLVSLPAPVE